MSEALPSQTTSAASNEGNRCGSVLHAMLRGSLGFGAVSVLAFAVWAFVGKWFHTHMGEGGLCVGCVVVFLVFTGLLLHPLVHDGNRWFRFYKIFVPAFCVYAVAWCAAWFLWQFGLGEWLGSLAGSVALAVMIGFGFRNFHPILKVSAIMFVLHSAGYFLGEMAWRWVAGANSESFGGHGSLISKLAFGLIYGLVVGAGLGYAFFTFQNCRGAKLQTTDAKPK
jgi:hypothetical protein